MLGSKDLIGLLNRLTNINTRSAVFLACLVLSFLFWLLTTLSKTYIEDIAIPVSYVDLPENKVLMSKLPERLFLEVEATGFEIIWMKMTGVGDELTIDASPNSLKRIPSADAGNYILVTEKKLNQIRSELDDQLSLVAIRPDTILFEFRNKVKKVVPVRFKGDVSFDGQYGAVDEMSFEPAVVTVTGPAEVLDTMQAIYTDSLVYKSVDETIWSELDLLSDKQDQPITIDPQTVNMKLTVEEFTEGTVTVPVIQKGTFSGGGVKVFPTTIEVKYLVPLSQFDNIYAEQFKTTVDLGQINSNETSSLEVTVAEHPVTVKRIRADPDRVEFIIQR